jgi:hypothetical protein
VAEGPVVETQIIDKASQEDAARRPASEFLEAGLKILTARAVLRDQPSGERSMAKTVAIFNAWTGNNISVQDGWRFMISLKQAREIQGFYNEDDYEDGTNYFALLGEEESSNLGRKKG